MKSLWIPVVYGVSILFILEITLRSIGYEPSHFFNEKKVPKGWEFDSLLGWKLLPGHYELGPFNDIGDSMLITIKKDTGRITKTNDLAVGSEQLLLIGGSFFLGHGLDDKETMAWKIQHSHPELDVRNLAVSGYGTLQSLIVLESELNKEIPPKCVIYGAIQHHELRNVAEGNWLMERRRQIPYAILVNDSTFKKMGLKNMWSMPFTNQFVVNHLTERALNRVLSYNRVQDAQQLSYLLIERMNELCNYQNVTFYVALLNYAPDKMKQLTRFLDQKDINYIDCNIPLTANHIIKDDGHPNEKVNDEWASRIELRLATDGIFSYE